MTNKKNTMANHLLGAMLSIACFATCSQLFAQGVPQSVRFEDPQQISVPALQELFNHNQLPMGNGQPVFQGASHQMQHPATLHPHMPVMAHQTQPGMSYYDGAGTVTSRAAEIDPNDPWEKPSEFEKFLYAVAKNSWFRLDYLHWSASKPGNDVFGHPEIQAYTNFTSSDTEVLDPRGPITVGDLGLVDETIFLFEDAAVGAVDLSGLSNEEKSGVRGTFGIPLQFGEFQMSGFLMEQMADEVTPSMPDSSLRFLLSNPSPFDGSNAHALPRYYLLPVTIDGQLATIDPFRETSGTDPTRQTNDILPELLYDEIKIRSTLDVWGGDMKFLIDLAHSKQLGLVSRPVVGASYLSIHEGIHTDGSRTNFDTFAPYVSTGEVHMSQDSFNNLYGGVIGLNLEFRHQYFVLGVEPKGVIGFNSYRTRIRTEDLAFAGETYHVQDTKTEFSPYFDFQAYCRVNVSERCALFAAYDLKYASKVARPHSQTNYDMVGDGSGGISATNFTVGTTLEEFRVDGLTIGAEFLFH